MEKRTADGKSKKNISLLASMLIMFFAALTVCVALTVLTFSFFGRRVYTRLITGEMLTQADFIAEEAKKTLNGEVPADSFRFMLRSVDSTVIILDVNSEPLLMMRDKKPDQMPEQQEQGEPEPRDGAEGMNRNDENIMFCRALLGDVTADPDTKFVKVDKERGAIVASLIHDSDENVLGAVFLIRPVADITSASRSLLIALVISSGTVGLLMLIPLFFMARWLTRPVERLTKAAAELSGGDYSKRVDPKGSLEVRELGTTFNTLAESLQETIGALTIERNRLRAILDGLNEGIIGFGRCGNVLRCNSSALRLLECPHSVEESPELDKIIALAQKVLDSGVGSTESFKIGERLISVSVAPFEEETGRLAGAVALLMDVTEAERLEQTRRDYVANVSHELRTPLASIRGIADMLNDGMVKSEDDKFRYYGYILNESIRLSKLINDLLELSRLQSGRVALKLSKVELYEIIADVADRMTDPARELGMNVDLTIPEGRYYANSNPDRVEQVLVTLMDNAVKHGTEGGTITVSMTDNETKWLISVANPAEIEKHDLEHIFERFYKADVAHTGEGTGLGLAIAEEVLQLLGETIDVTYENGIIRFTFSVTKKL